MSDFVAKMGASLVQNHTNTYMTIDFKSPLEALELPFYKPLKALGEKISNPTG